MENIIDHNEREITLSDRELFTKIWTSPRQVFRYINDYKYDKYVPLLLVLAGIANAFDRAVRGKLGDGIPLLIEIGMVVVLGGLLGWLSYYIWAALLSWTGGWLQGQAKTSALTRMLAFAVLPTLLMMFLSIPQLVLSGMAMSNENGPAQSAGWVYTVVVYGTGILEVIFTIWYIALVVIGISEVQKFSIGKSILNLILPAIIIGVPLVFIVFALIKF